MAESGPAHFDECFFSALADLEDGHFWFRGRNRVIEAALDRFAPTLPSPWLGLELGCGTGNVLRVLEKAPGAGLVVGIDLFMEGLEVARQRSCRGLLRADIQRPCIRSGVHMVAACDVIEHLPDDLGCLRAARDLLLPGGLLVLTVPANPALWSYFDDASGHCRRYEVDGLVSLLGRAGFTIELLSPFMAALAPLLWLRRRLRGRGRVGEKAAMTLAMGDLAPMPRPLNALLAACVAFEPRLLARGWRLPLGSSLLAVARRPTA